MIATGKFVPFLAAAPHIREHLRVVGLLDASDMPVPDLQELKAELDALRARRG